MVASYRCALLRNTNYNDARFAALDLAASQPKLLRSSAALRYEFAASCSLNATALALLLRSSNIDRTDQRLHQGRRAEQKGRKEERQNRLTGGGRDPF
jgi:hypothetical protein